MMIQTEQLSPDTIIFHIHGPFHSNAAKDLGLAVWQSYRFGFTTYLIDLGQASLIDDEGVRQLACIGQGLENKGSTWKVVANPKTSDYQTFRTALDQLPNETWN